MRKAIYVDGFNLEYIVAKDSDIVAGSIECEDIVHKRSTRSSDETLAAGNGLLDRRRFLVRLLQLRERWELRRCPHLQALKSFLSSPG